MLLVLFPPPISPQKCTSHHKIKLFHVRWQKESWIWWVILSRVFFSFRAILPTVIIIIDIVVKVYKFCKIWGSQDCDQHKNMTPCTVVTDKSDVFTVKGDCRMFLWNSGMSILKYKASRLRRRQSACTFSCSLANESILSSTKLIGVCEASS
jgi:hypothetical protein